MTHRDAGSISPLQVRLDSLASRLEDGEQRISAAERRGEDVRAWEQFWLQLLHEYESLHGQIDAEAADARMTIAA